MYSHSNDFLIVRMRGFEKGGYRLIVWWIRGQPRILTHDCWKTSFENQDDELQVQ
jgi:hypothetical protein